MFVGDLGKGNLQPTPKPETIVVLLRVRTAGAWLRHSRKKTTAAEFEC